MFGISMRPTFKADLKRLNRETESRASHGVGVPAPTPALRLLRYSMIGLALAVLLAAAATLYRWRRPAAVSRSEWVQLTDFADSVSSPALSGDGRMLTFIRGPQTFTTSGQIYIRFLPDGQPVQLTHDDKIKMSPRFTPDGTAIAYTVPWDTLVVPVLGGEPQLFLPNAAGLTWIDAHRLLFSEISQGVHMAIVTATDSRTESRAVYVPPAGDGMAHRSYLSPDGKWVLVAEMDVSAWLPCRVVPFDGSSLGTLVGPGGGSICQSAAWSPDGKWIYLTSNFGGDFTSGGSASLRASPSRSPPDLPRKKTSAWRPMGARLLPPSVCGGGRYGCTTAAANARSPRKAMPIWAR
jgi:eukaryotic-like serine/threonine-protein kinase